MKQLVLTLVVWSLALGACVSAPLGGNNLASVDGDPITREDLEIRRKIYQLFFRQPMDDSASQGQLLDQMVTERLLLRQAERMQVRVSEAQVGSELDRFFGVLEKQYKSREEATRQLQNAGLTNDLLAGFIKDFLTSQEVIDQKKAEARLTPEEIRAFYDQNLEKLYTFPDESVRAAHVLVPTDQELQAREVAAKAQAGGEFGLLARQYSVDAGSARLGGDLGYFTRGVMVQAFTDAVFALDVGEVSDPVQSQFGWHIIRLSDRQPAGTIPFAMASENAANRLLPDRQEEVYAQWLQELQRTARIQRAFVADALGRR